jgi:predicted AlkP superfamily pyrophosphatase or phosphodiesterase
MQYRKLIFLPLLLFVQFLPAQPDTTQKIIDGRKNSPEQQQKPYVILISIDGFRYDYAEKHGAKNLLKLSSQGISAGYMMPSYPSLTFPNHYSLVTGMHPSHHGLVNNHFYEPASKDFYSMRIPEAVKDGKWYGGTPLWVLADQQQMLSASFYWVGSEADIQGIHPTYYYNYNEVIPIEQRIQTVVDWLSLPADRRPHLITFYFPEVDHKGHSHGPDAPETRDAVQWVDASIKKLANAVSKTGLPVNFIIVSDHGMTLVDTVNTLSIPPVIDTSQFIIPRGAELLSLYAKNKDDVLPAYRALKKAEKNFTVYLKEEMPEHLRYGAKDDRLNRIGDILLVAKWPKIFHSSSRKPNPGAHGFDPVHVKDMHTIFYAWGPAFKKGLKIPEVRNIDVYPLVTKILGLHYSHEIDGNPELAEKILK